MRTELLSFVLLASTCACNRVPVPETPPNALVSQASPDASSSGATPAAPEEDDAIEGLCSRACDNWVGLRFQQPVGWAQVPDTAKPAAIELLARQKALNRADCEERCTHAKKPDLAKCLLAAKNAEAATTCASQ